MVTDAHRPRPHTLSLLERSHRRINNLKDFRAAAALEPCISFLARARFHQTLQQNMVRTLETFDGSRSWSETEPTP